jgi:hypothetical protein
LLPFFTYNELAMTLPGCFLLLQVTSWVAV